jgi:hypothetical protein
LVLFPRSIPLLDAFFSKNYKSSTIHPKAPRKASADLLRQLQAEGILTDNNPATSRYEQSTFNF